MKLVRGKEARQWCPPGHTGVISQEVVPIHLTNGKAEIHLSINAPGSSSALDVHDVAEQTFYIIEGALTFTDGKDQYEARAGDAVFVAAGVPHAMTNYGQVTAVFLVVTAPPLA